MAPEPHSRRPPRRPDWLHALLTTRVRTLLMATGTFLLFGTIIVLLSAYFVNSMKDHLVELAHEEVDRLARESVSEIERIVAEYERTEGRALASLGEVANDPTIKAQLRIMTASGAVVMSAMMDSEGNCFYQQFGPGGASEHCPLRKGRRLAGILPASDEPMTWEMEFRDYPEGVVAQQLPVRGDDGRTLGYIAYGMEKNLTLESLDPVSHRITGSLVWMVTGVLLCLGLAMGMLHLVWNRHHDLQQRHHDAQHLANIGTLASGLAHEIRNPLHAMNLHLDAVREELQEPRSDSVDFATTTLANVQTQIQSLNAIVSNFMNYALPERLEREPMRLAAVLGEVSTLIEPEFIERGARLLRDVSEKAWIVADATAVRQVLTNVLLNAAQAVENSPVREVHVRALAVEGGRWRLIVEDTGPGLPPGREEDIFQVFFTARKGGTGFGLPIARRIMQAHGGRLVGETRPEGGARFILDFPAADVPQDAPAVAGSPRANAPAIG
ncbi:MAG: HAMP domain-containing histidine kinase [Candidatus Sumerlaeia bacterium]|nr:HAMP domain-containing histidine kinase [Candidatus Sumerlaeia bacterium]